MPKIVDHVKYRKHLLEQSFDLFAQHGYEALTMRQIAEVLHVSTGTLYYYFPTKEALFHQLVEEVTQQAVAEITSLVQPLATLRERLLALWEYIARHEDGFQKHSLILLNYYQHRDLYGEAAGAILQDAGTRYHEAVSGVLGLHDPQLCFLLQCQIDGLLMLRMLHGITGPFIEQAHLFTDMLMDHLQKHGYGEEDPIIAPVYTKGENVL